MRSDLGAFSGRTSTAKRMARLGNGSKFMGSYMGGPSGQTAGDAGEIG